MKQEIAFIYKAKRYWLFHEKALQCNREKFIKRLYF